MKLKPHPSTSAKHRCSPIATCKLQMGLRDGTLFLLLRLHESLDPDENKPELPLAPGIPSLTNFNSGQSLIHRNMLKAKPNSRVHEATRIGFL